MIWFHQDGPKLAKLEIDLITFWSSGVRSDRAVGLPVIRILTVADGVPKKQCRCVACPEDCNAVPAGSRVMFALQRERSKV